ncbi:putative adenylate/guanylate cyclase [Candidatus Moduliflexus flocculans]|uniref:histidine kinase n=1 Tax=Candidatus Moduliflexus flocculans TaxID=1499966 RepID=A0A081BM34_9BACT|nr:putative adenylate/guanylate cyclase [Candidatus Moduliflexus flocculans]
MSLRRKVLLRIYLLIMLMIVAMSVTYYYLFTRDIRERSQQSISTAMTMILDDFATKAHDIPIQINQFLENSVSKPLYTLQLIEQEFDQTDKESLLWSVKKSMTYIDAIASRMRDFAGLVDAAEIVIYNKHGKLLTTYRNEAGTMTTGALIPGLSAETFVILNPGDRWYAAMQTIDEIPAHPLLDNLSTTYADAVPERLSIELSQFQTFLALKFTMPIIERGELQGICVVQRAIQSKDARRYARLAGAEVNIFVGESLSVGTLPAFKSLPAPQRDVPQELNFEAFPLMPVLSFSEMTVQGTSYYQGTLTLGDQQSQIGAMTIHYPRSLEEKQKKNFIRVVFGIAVIFSALAVLEALGLSSAIVQPIMRLVNAMSEMKQGNLNIAAKVESNDEIGLLADSFNGMITQIRDDFQQIDEQRQRLEQQNAELQRLDKMKDQFLSNTSHELRTPLNGIAGLADALLSGVDGALNPEERKHVRMILQSSKRLSHLVNSLLDFSKIRSNKLELHIRPFPLPEVVEVALAFLRPQADEKGLELRMDFPENLPEVRGDLDKVEQIITNLLGNAVKFTREGSVTVSAQQEGDMVKILVKDTGIGIPREAQERIFSPFEQADGSTTREFGGTGLGLAISKELVELHRGEIGVISEPGMGSEFYFTLPAGETLWNGEAKSVSERSVAVISAPAVEELEGNKVENLPAIQISGKGHRILVIDDDPTNVEVLKTQLEHVGFEVWKASDGKEAFDVVNGYTVDLILCDVMMPLVDGYTFAMRMRERENLKNIPLIFVSAKTQKADIIKGYQAGAIDYLAKPVESDELLFKVNAIINAQQHRTAHRTGAVVGLPDTFYDTDEDKEQQLMTAPHGNGEKILVVDDEPINLEVIKAQLTQYNYQVVTASNGSAALELLDREEPELVLLDLMMPKMSGFKVCKIIRRDKRLIDLPIVMLTAKSNLYDKIYGLNIGANDYLIKPFDKEELLTRIYVLLTLSALQQRLVETNIGLQAEVVERRQAEEALRRLNEELEDRVSARTADLQASLETLKQTQQQLVQSEKIAALGELVAGMAHEINTPLGVCITAASHLQDRSRDLESHYTQGQMRRSEIERFWQISQQSLDMLMTNLTQMSRQIQTFKQVAVNETHVEQRRFVVREMLENALFSIKNDLTAANHRLTISGGESVVMESYPGAFSHVMNSLVMNSLTHAYPSKQTPGELRIEIAEAEDSIMVRYADDGCGISPEHLSRLFQPFFTTSRGTNTGLGLHIVYNLVTHKMRGNIRCESEVGKGATFIIELPKTIR